jgi:hypothetical protein
MRRQISHSELVSLFQAIGEAVWYLQYTEDALNTYLTMKVDIKAPAAASEERGRELLAKYRQYTLGQSLKVAESNSVLPEHLHTRLEALKLERNWLVHRSMNEEGDSLYTDEGRRAIFIRLETFVSEATALRSELLKEIDSFVRSYGISVETAETMAKRKIAALKGEN